jgi:hypothetical protein
MEEMDKVNQIMRCGYPLDITKLPLIYQMLNIIKDPIGDILLEGGYVLNTH